MGVVGGRGLVVGVLEGGVGVAVGDFHLGELSVHLVVVDWVVFGVLHVSHVGVDCDFGNVVDLVQTHFLQGSA